MIQFFILRYSYANRVQYFFSGHSLGLMMDLEYAAAFQNEIFQLLFVNWLLRLFGRCQAFIGQLVELKAVRTEGLVQIEQFQWRRCEFAEHRWEYLYGRTHE